MTNLNILHVKSSSHWNKHHAWTWRKSE